MIRNLLMGLSIIFLLLSSVKAQSEKGVASWYSPTLAGAKTASGEIYTPNKLTAAHRTLPFNTYVQVTNLQNNKSVVVRINDRGPFIKGRIIDLSQSAADDIGIIRQGTAQVKIAPSLEETLDQTSYQNLAANDNLTTQKQKLFPDSLILVTLVTELSRQFYYFGWQNYTTNP